MSWALVSWALVSWAEEKTRFVSTRFVSTRFVKFFKNSFREHSFREHSFREQKKKTRFVSTRFVSKLLTSLYTNKLISDCIISHLYSFLCNTHPPFFFPSNPPRPHPPKVLENFSLFVLESDFHCFQVYKTWCWYQKYILEMIFKLCKRIFPILCIWFFSFTISEKKFVEN